MCKKMCKKDRIKKWLTSETNNSKRFKNAIKTVGLLHGPLSYPRSIYFLSHSTLFFDAVLEALAEWKPKAHGMKVDILLSLINTTPRLGSEYLKVLQSLDIYSLNPKALSILLLTLVPYSFGEQYLFIVLKSTELNMYNRLTARQCSKIFERCCQFANRLDEADVKAIRAFFIEHKGNMSLRFRFHWLKLLTNLKGVKPLEAFGLLLL